MSSAKTETLKLNQWVPADYVSMGEFNDNFQKIDEAHKEVATQLAENIRETKPIQQSKRRPLVTFTSDDGLPADITILKPIFLKYNIPCVTALITKDLNYIQERLDLQNNHGWEISSHTVNHAYLNSPSEDELDYELRQSKKDLEDVGFKVDSVIYPYGVHTEASRRISKKYYKMGAEMGFYQVNTGVIPSFAIARTGLGSVFDVVDGQEMKTLEYYKSKVDEAVANNGWCVFMLHSGNTSFDATQQSYLEQTIQYVQSLGIDIVTLREGYEVFGNTVETGDFTLTSSEGFAFSKTGEIGNKIAKLIKNTGLNNASPVQKFPAYCVSMTSFLNADKGGFPTSAGTLVTSRLNTIEDISYQEWYPYDDTRQYKRVWSSGAWKPWVELGNQVIPKTGLNNASLITAFPKLQVSTTTFLNADNGGFPTSAGTLVTSRASSVEDINYQLWIPFDSNTIYKRRWASNAWQSWKLIAGEPTSWAGIVATSTNWTKVGTFTVANYINFVTWYSGGGSQPTLTKNTWALTEISADSTTPTVIGTAGSGRNIEAYKDANGSIYVKYSSIGNNYSSFFNVAFC